MSWQMMRWPIGGYNAAVHVPAAGGGGSAQAIFASSNSNSSSLATYTFTGQSLGGNTLQAGDVVVVCMEARGVSAAAPSAFTINGSAATAVVAEFSAISPQSYIYALAVSSGTTVDISYTYASAPLRSAIQVYIVRGSSGTASSPVSNSGSDTISTAVTIPTSGCAIACGFDLSAGATTTTPSSFTPNDVDLGMTNEFVSCHSNTATGATTVQYAFSGAGGAAAICAAAWGP